jgi:hypothetical protein
MVLQYDAAFGAFAGLAESLQRIYTAEMIPK